MWRIYTRGEESRKMPFKVIDSSLGVMLLFPVFPTRNSCIHSEWRMEEEDKSYQLWAVSYKLLAVSCELKAEAYDFHLVSYETSAKDLFVVVREMLNVIRSEREGSITVMRKTVRRHPER